MTHAIKMYTTGGSDVLKWERHEPGMPGDGEALIRHEAVGLNFIDVYHRTGLYPLPYRLGFGYQLAFVRLLNRFPTQVPFELLNDILAYVSIQLGIPSENIDAYNKRQPTISDHQETIRRYLSLVRFAEADQKQLATFMFEKALA